MNCSDGHEYGCNYGDQGNMAYAPLYVTNGCAVRVWIYQGGGRHGYSLCISNGIKTGRLGRIYTYYWVSNNITDCPDSARSLPSPR
jgi:hypothetical protein